MLMADPRRAEHTSIANLRPTRSGLGLAFGHLHKPMSPALLRPCATPGCPALVTGVRCSRCATAREQQRGTRSERGYDARWQRFRQWFIDQLIAKGIPPACGAALPGGPSMADSRCRRRDRVETDKLHLDHDPPLQPHERRDWRRVCDPLRVGFLCASCHSAKTRSEQNSGASSTGR